MLTIVFLSPLNSGAILNTDPLRILIIARSGGLDMLFSNQRKHSVSLPTIDENGKPSTMASLVRHLCKYVMKDPREDFFVVDDAMFVALPQSP